MRKAYLFIYNDEVGTRQQLKKIIDSMSTVITWRYDLPHVFYVISENSAVELYEEFCQVYDATGRFMFIECTTNKQGKMLSDTWYLLNNKTSNPKKK